MNRTVPLPTSPLPPPFPVATYDFSGVYRDRFAFKELDYSYPAFRLHEPSHAPCIQTVHINKKLQVLLLYKFMNLPRHRHLFRIMSCV
jgi:hypothetical protein